MVFGPWIGTARDAAVMTKDAAAGPKDSVEEIYPGRESFRGRASS
jgi:hypothetical protein